MQKSEKFFIFSWKELLVLVLVGMTAMGFFFTLGLHYGKKIGVDMKPAESQVANLESSPEIAPPKETLEQGAQHSESVAEEAVQGATQKAIEENKLKIDHPKPVDLPESKAAPASKPAEGKTEAKTEAKSEAKADSKPEPKSQTHEAAESETAADSAAGGAAAAEAQEPAQAKFAIQLGSYPNAKEAQKRVATFSKRGLKTEIRTAVVNSETRYRVVMPGFKTRKVAEIKGKDLKGARKIENFVIIKAE